MAVDFEFLDRLRELYDDALTNYRENKNPPTTAAGAYDAGVVEGLRRALEVAEQHQ